MSPWHCRQLLRTLTSSPRKRERGASSPLSLLAPTMHQAVVMTHGSQYEGKTTLPPRQRRSTAPSPISSLLRLSLLEWTHLPGSWVTLGPGLACFLGNTGGSH